MNPYVAGNPVGGSPAFVGRQRLLREVLAGLASPGENGLVLHGQRRIGKTSVLLELTARLGKEGPYVPIYFDLQDQAARPLAQVVARLARELVRRLDGGKPPRWGEEAPRAFRDELLPRLLKRLPKGRSIVLLFDEFDVLDTAGEGQAAKAFFPYLRELLSLAPRRLQFLFAIGRRPEELSSLTLSVFKGMRSLPVSLLSPQETEALVRLSEADGSLTWSDEAVRWVQAVSGGHPFLSQQLCQVVWEEGHDAEPAEAGPVTPEQVEASVPQTLRSATNSLVWLWEGLGPAERVVASALAGAGAGVITRETLEARLQESGVRILVGELQDAPRVLQDWDLLEPVDGGFRFRVELLRRWIAERKPLSTVQDELDRIQPVAENLFQAAYSLYRSGDFDGAVPRLKDAISFNPNHLRANQILAEILLARGKAGEARELLEKLHEYRPDAARPRLVQALLQEAEGTDAEKGRLALLERALELEPDQPEAVAARREIFRHRAERSLERGDLETALAAYREAGLAEEAQEVAGRIREKAARRGVDLVQELLTEEAFHAAAEKAAELHRDFPELADQLPDLEALRRKAHLDERYRQALGALQEGDRAMAAQLLGKVVAADPGFREATRYLHLAQTGVDVAELERRLARMEGREKKQPGSPASPESPPRTGTGKGAQAAGSQAAPRPAVTQARNQTQKEAPERSVVQVLAEYDQVDRQAGLSRFNPLSFVRWIGWTLFSPDRFPLPPVGVPDRRHLAASLAASVTWLPLFLALVAALPSGKPASVLSLSPAEVAYFGIPLGWLLTALFGPAPYGSSWFHSLLSGLAGIGVASISTFSGLILGSSFDLPFTLFNVGLAALAVAVLAAALGLVLAPAGGLRAMSLGSVPLLQVGSLVVLGVIVSPALTSAGAPLSMPLVQWALGPALWLALSLGAGAFLGLVVAGLPIIEKEGPAALWLVATFGLVSLLLCLASLAGLVYYFTQSAGLAASSLLVAALLGEGVGVAAAVARGVKTGPGTDPSVLTWLVLIGWLVTVTVILQRLVDQSLP